MNLPRRRRTALERTLLSLAVAGCFPVEVMAAPLDPSVVSGSAHFEQAGHTLTITNTPGAVIEWRGFSVGVGEITRFVQQSAASSVLNRVTGQDPSQILGRLESNGQVFLINPNGIVFGRDSVVDVGGLVASTLPLSNADFAAGRLNFGPGGGAIENHGLLQSVLGGRIFLVAQDVRNHGIIQSPDGQILLAAGSEASLVDTRRPHIQVSVAAPAGGEALNVGRLVAGHVGIYAAAIRHAGVVQATGAHVDAGGEIVFSASRTLDVAPGSHMAADGLSGGRVRLQAGDTALVAGTVSATGSAGQGGRVDLLGRQVGVLDAGRIDVSGGLGGGLVHVGGGLRGADATLPNAQALWFGPGAVISADATVAGNGGTVVLWSETVSRAYGGITARGGAAGGNGGFVEASSRGQLQWGGTADTRAPLGRTGTLLFDPTNIWIASNQASATDAGMVGTDNSASTGGGTPFTFEASGSPTDSLLTVASLTAALAANSVVVTTASSGSADGNIHVVDPVAWTANTLTLDAANGIFIDAVMSALGTSRLELLTGAGGAGVNMGFNPLGGFAGRVDFPGRTGFGFLKIGGDDFFVINSLGTETSAFGSDLQGMRTFVSRNYALGENIDAAPTSTWNGGLGFTPVGRTDVLLPFTGKFNGLGHTITGLTINRPTEGEVGLFGATFDADIRNVGLVGGSMRGDGTTGSLAGNVGGTAAGTNSFVANTYSAGAVVNGGSSDTGGLIGYAQNTLISTSHSSSFVAGDAAVGGLVGSLDASGVVASHASGSVTGDSLIGGLVGNNLGVISGSYASGNVSANGQTGGLAGKSAGTVGNSYATGNVSATADAGGLVGLNEGLVSDSYATGNVTGVSNKGGLVGRNLSGLATGSYWLKPSDGSRDALDNLIGSGLDESAMTDPTTFIASGWDGTVWKLQGPGYPRLLDSIVTDCSTAVCWDGGAGTDNWLDALNWSTDLVPTSSQRIFIPARPGVIQLGFGSLDTYRSLASDASVTMGGIGTVVFTGNVTFGNGTTFKIDGGTVKVAGAVHVADTFVMASSGVWEQISNPLPSFYARDLRLDSLAARFLRAAGGDGTTASPYLLTDIYGLQGVGAGGTEAAHFRLAGNVDASGTKLWNGATGFRPLTGSIGSPFSGTLDGNDKTVSGLFIRGGSNVGLFGTLDHPTAEIRNLGLVNVDISAGGNVGALVGSMGNGKVINSFATGEVSGTSNVGGLIGAVRPGTVSGALDNSFYDVDSVRINGATGVVTTGGIYAAQYADWIAGKTLDPADYFAQAGGYYLIDSVQKLKDFLGFSAAGSGFKFRLASDLNLSSVSGFHVPVLAIAELDGAGHTVRNFTLERPTDHDVAFIGRIAGIATVKNLRLDNVLVKGTFETGGLTGRNLGAVIDSHSGGSVTGVESFTGGLAGRNYGSISGSSASGSVTGARFTGGLVGYSTSSGAVTNSFYDADSVLINGATGVISIGGLYAAQYADWVPDRTLDPADYFSQTGGYYTIDSVARLKNLLGFATAGAGFKFRLASDLSLSSVSNFYVPELRMDEFDGAGKVISNFTIDRPDEGAIGFIGRIISGTVTNFRLENITVKGYDYAGGLAGINAGTVSNSHAIGSVTSSSTGEGSAGGLVGWNRSAGVVTNTYASGSVTGLSAAGLVAQNDGTVSKSYATSAVTGTSSAGGLIASNGGTVADSFWDTQTSGQTASAGGTGRTTAQMKDPATFSAAGWSTTVWKLDPGAYPLLLGTGLPVCSADVCWIATVSGLWKDGVNWSTGVAPLAGQTVRVSQPGALTITVDAGAQHAKNLFIDENLEVSGGSLTLAGSSTLNGLLTISGGAFTLSPGASATAGTVNLSGGTLLANGSLNAARLDMTGSGILGGSAAVAVSGSFGIGGTIDRTGNLSITQGSGSLLFGGASVGGLTLVANNGGIVVDGSITASGNVVMTGSGSGNAVGVSIEGDVVTSGASSIQITGTGGNVAGGTMGVKVGGGTLEAVNGGITITGTRSSGASGASNAGVTLTDATVRTTGTGNISITGGGAATGATTDNAGIVLDTSAVRALGGGRVSLTGTAAGNTAGGNHGVSLKSASEVLSNAAVAGAIAIRGEGASGDAGVRTDGTANRVLASSSGGGVSLTSTAGAIEIGAADVVQALGALALSSVGGMTQAPGGSLTAANGFKVAGTGPFRFKGTGSYGGAIALEATDVRFESDTHNFKDSAVVTGTLKVDGAEVIFGNVRVNTLQINAGTARVSSARTLTVTSLSQSGGLLEGPGSLTVTRSYAHSDGGFGAALDTVSIRQGSGNLDIDTNISAARVDLTAAAGAVRIRDAQVSATGRVSLSGNSASVTAVGLPTEVSGARVTVTTGGNLTIQGGSASSASARLIATEFECGGTVGGDLVLKGGAGPGAHAVMIGADIGRLDPGELSVGGAITMTPGAGGHARIESINASTIHLAFPNQTAGGYSVAGSPVVSSGDSGFFAGGAAALPGINLLTRYAPPLASALAGGSSPVVVEINNLVPVATSPALLLPPSSPGRLQEGDLDQPAAAGRCL